MGRDIARIVKWVLGAIAFAVAVWIVAEAALGQIGKNWRYPFDPKTAPTSTVAAHWPAVPEAAETCAGYDRDAFGGFAKATVTAVWEHAQHGGDVIDGWTGRPLVAADDPQIDHIVPVHEAYCSGLQRAQYQAFYNDVDNLVLTAGEVNNRKSDKEPGQWAAPTFDAQCRFASTWVAVKVKWHLTMDPAEAGRVARIEQTCGAA